MRINHLDRIRIHRKLEGGCPKDRRMRWYYPPVQYTFSPIITLHYSTYKSKKKAKNKKRCGKRKIEGDFSSSTLLSAPKRSLFADLDSLLAAVVATIRTQTMSTLVLAALSALYQRRGVQLPDVVTSLITPGFGCFSLGYRHVSTSLH